MLYADDAVVFAKSPESLQSILNDIELYCNTWGLKINTAKTKAMIFETSRHATQYDFYINNVKLEVVRSFKYLGIYFFENGNWHRTQKQLSQHAAFAIHYYIDVMVGSVLNYSAEVWGYHEANDIEMLHTKFCRWSLKV